MGSAFGIDLQITSGYLPLIRRGALLSGFDPFLTAQKLESGVREINAQKLEHLTKRNCAFGQNFSGFYHQNPDSP